MSNNFILLSKTAFVKEKEIIKKSQKAFAVFIYFHYLHKTRSFPIISFKYPSILYILPILSMRSFFSAVWPVIEDPSASCLTFSISKLRIIQKGQEVIRL